MADPYKSEDTQLAVGTEDTQGTAVAPTRVFGKVAEDATPPDPEVAWEPIRVIGGDREVFQMHEGQHEYQGGDIPVILIDGAPLAYAFGSETVNADEDLDGGSETGTTTHILTPKMDGKPPSQTIEAVYYGRGGGTDFVRTFPGGTVNECEISTNNDDELTASLSYWAMGVTPGTSPTGSITVPDRNPWLFSDAASQLSLFGTSFARFVSFTYTLSNNLEEGRYIAPDSDHPSGDAKDPYEITYGNADHELSATIAVEDDALYTELVNATAGGFTATIEFERPNGDNLRITLTGCQITSAPHDIPADASKIEVEVSITAESAEIRVEDSNSAGTGYLA